MSNTFYLYGALDTTTNKLVSDITNPRRKYWDREGNAKKAVNSANSKYNYHYGKYNGNLKVVKIRCEVEDNKKPKFKITELHGMIKDKFYIQNKHDASLCALDNHPASNTGLPIVFNTQEEAKAYLSCVTDIEDAIIASTKISFFNNGVVLFEQSENGVNIFSFD